MAKEIEYTRIDGEKLSAAFQAYRRRTGKSQTWLSYRIADSGSMISNAILRNKIATKYIKPLEAAGINPADYVIDERPESAPEAAEKAHSAQEAKGRPDDQDLRKELLKLRDDVTDLGVLLNAIREERSRDTEKLLQALGRLADRQLTRKEIGEEIVSGIILAAGQMNIDQPIRDAYEAIRNDLQRDIYRAMKGVMK